MGIPIKTRALNFLVCANQFTFCILTLGGSAPDETMSSAVYRMERDGRFWGFMLTVPEFANGAWAILDRGQVLRMVSAIGSSSNASAELFNESCVSTTEAGAQLAISKNGESFDFLLTDPQLPNSALATLSRDQTLRLIAEMWRDFDADAL